MNEASKMWIRDKTLPTESGYYLTIYNNQEQKAMMYKAFWFDTKNSKWIFRFDPDVIAWWNVRHDYYIPCQTQENVDRFVMEGNMK